MNAYNKNALWLSLFAGVVVAGALAFFAPLAVVLVASAGTGLVIYAANVIVLKMLVIQASNYIFQLEQARRCDVVCPCSEKHMLENVEFSTEEQLLECEHCNARLICRFKPQMTQKG